MVHMCEHSISQIAKVPKSHYTELVEIRISIVWLFPLEWTSDDKTKTAKTVYLEIHNTEIEGYLITIILMS